MRLCGVRDVMGKNKIAIFLVVVFASFFTWIKLKPIELKIASVTFKVPHSSVVSASATRGSSGDLDNTEGAFLALPNGPYHGKWGIFLQSSKERKGKEFPSPFDNLVVKNNLDFKDVFKKNSSGWYECIESCGKNVWYFKKIPTNGDSVYSVKSVVCHETRICELLFVYQDVDVSVSLQQNDIEKSSEILEQAAAMLASLTVRGK